MAFGNRRRLVVADLCGVPRKGLSPQRAYCTWGRRESIRKDTYGKRESRVAYRAPEPDRAKVAPNRILRREDLLPPSQMDRPPSFKFAYRTLVTPGVVFLVICITCVLAILFTFIGPFGIRRTLSISERAGFCALWGVLDLLVCYPAGVLTLYLARFRTRWQMMLAITGYALVTAAPCTAIGIAVYSLFHDGRAPVGSLILTYTVCAASLMSSTALVYHVVSLRLRIASSAAAPIADAAAAPDPDSAGRDGTLTGRSEAIETATAAGPALAVTADTRGDQARASGEDIEPGEAVVTIEQPAEPEPTRHFFARVPEALGRDVIFLRVSDHYIEVTTTAGTTVILMRFSDAVAALGDMGMRIHRSYWVAYRHINHVMRRDRRTLLRVTGDRELPVSRSFLAEVRAASQRSRNPT